MRISFRICFLFSIFNFTINRGYAATYYLSNLGNDSNVGTSIFEPWQSIAKLNTVTFLPGDSVLFLSGNIFRGQINLLNGGDENSPIYFGTYGGANPAIISGAELVTGWSVYLGDIYKAPFTGFASQLFMNGKRMTISRYPNSGFLIREAGIGSIGFVDSALTQADSFWNGAIVRMRISDRNYETDTVSSFSNYTVLFSDTAPGPVAAGYGYYFDNVFYELDSISEWYLSTGSQLIYLKTTSDPDTNVLEASVYDHGLLIQNGSSYITVENLRFEKQMLNGIYDESFTSGVIVKNCSFYSQGGSAVSFVGGSSKCNITSSELNDCLGEGLQLVESQSCVISGNEIKNVGLVPGYGVNSANQGFGIDLTTADTTIVENNFIDSTGNGAIFLGGNNCRIERNYCDHNILILNDLGGIYLYAPEGSNNMIKENFVLNTKGNTLGTPGNNISVGAIYLDETSENDSIQNNTIAFSSGRGILFDNGASDNSIANNLVFGCSESQLEFNKGILHSENNSIRNNILYSIRENSDPVRLVSDSLSFIPGVFDSNFYFNPYDYFSFHYQTIEQNHGYDYYYTLKQWQDYAGNDQHSSTTFFKWDRYKVVQTTSDNLITNGTFTNNFDGWATDDSSNIFFLLDNSTPLDFGCLKLLKPSPLPFPDGNVYASGFNIDSSLYYMLTISCFSTINRNVAITLRQNGEDYNFIAEKRFFPFSPLRNDYSFTLKPFASFESSRFEVLLTYIDSLVWIDNAGIYSADVSYEDPLKKSRLFINPSASEKSFDLGDTIFFDLNQNLVTQQLTLPPYSSTILIFDSSMILHQEEPITDQKNVSAFPNPIHPGNHLQINLNRAIDETIKLLLYDVRGQLLDEKTFSLFNSILNYKIPNHISDGVYFLRLAGKTNQFLIKVVVSQ